MHHSKRVFGIFSAVSFFSLSPYFKSPARTSEPDRKQEFENFLSGFQLQFVNMIQSFESIDFFEVISHFNETSQIQVSF